MSDVTSIPIPIALKELILSNNQLLKNYQEDLTNKVLVANREMMTLLGLSEKDGWVIDLQTLSYVKSPTPKE
jgi:hypothetical protein